MKNGITVAGNILVDKIKMLESYPQKGMLSTITSISQGVGGAVPNTGCDIKRINPAVTVKACGKVADDDAGKYVLGVMSENGMDVSGVAVVDGVNHNTSFSDVMTVSGTGERTFFHSRGANAEFGIEDVDVDKIDTDMFHIGYLMLLDRFDKIQPDGSTEMAKLLENVRKRGVKTSIDVVSESSGNFNKVVMGVLPHTDYVIINEIETGNIAGIETVDADGNVIKENVKKAMQYILDGGVNEKVIVHCPSVGFCLDKSGRFTEVPSLKLPKGYIKGSVGAGDAFCAGTLYGLYSGWDDEKILRFSAAVAASNLSAPDSISGVNSEAEIWALDSRLRA